MNLATASAIGYSCQHPRQPYLSFIRPKALFTALNWSLPPAALCSRPPSDLVELSCYLSRCKAVFLSPHQTQTSEMETKMPGSCRYKSACQHRLRIICLLQCGYMVLLSSGMAALLDSRSRSSAPACRYKEWCYWDRCPLHHCACSPTQPDRRLSFSKGGLRLLVLTLFTAVGQPRMLPPRVQSLITPCHSQLQAGHVYSALQLLPADTCYGTFTFLLWFQY